MAVFTASADYTVFKEAVDGVGELGTVLYWDGTSGPNAFYIYASVAGGRTWIVCQIGGIMTPPATFASDFPAAIPISGALAVL